MCVVQPGSCDPNKKKGEADNNVSLKEEMFLKLI